MASATITTPTPPGRQEERPNRLVRTTSQASLALEPAWWRLGLHLTLATGATPLPGAALAAARMLRQAARTEAGRAGVRSPGRGGSHHCHWHRG